MFFRNTRMQGSFHQKIWCTLQFLQRNISSNIAALAGDKYQDIWIENDSLYEMPKSKEYLSTDESSNNSSEDEKPKKKLKKEVKKPKLDKSAEDDSLNKKATSSNKINEAEPTWELGNMKEIKVREWRGKLYIDIREMYLDKSGDMKPGKKGISLNTSQFKKLVECIEEVDQAVKAKS